MIPSARAILSEAGILPDDRRAFLSSLQNFLAFGSNPPTLPASQTIPWITALSRVVSSLSQFRSLLSNGDSVASTEPSSEPGEPDLPPVTSPVRPFESGSSDSGFSLADLDSDAQRALEESDGLVIVRKKGNRHQ
jgi:hypothetical protein